MARNLSWGAVVNALACACLALLAGLHGACAEGVGEFYRGKTIELEVGTGAGGGYDANARLVARHLGRFIPGNPTIIVSNLPGGGGIPLVVDGKLVGAVGVAGSNQDELFAQAGITAWEKVRGGLRK